MPTEPPPGEVTINLDGRPVPAVAGEMIIAAAERAGVYIPRFCYHPRMKPVGMCRMCLVDLKGPRGFALTPACFATAARCRAMPAIVGYFACKQLQDARDLDSATVTAHWLVDRA